ncbi:MAG TPA: NAD-dependent epimerase/dehydratase family protein [Blastocatellia bacterium]|nr:NAD-dependent epimerase/dehydratase family protein [Blastocatellia bacterium]
MKILITGAAGFIGTHVSERLAERGDEVHAVDCLTDYYPSPFKILNARALQAKGVPLFSLDLAEDDLSRVVHNVEVIIHLAALPGISATASFEAYARNNLLATSRLLEAAKRWSSLRGFVYISTSSVYGVEATGNEEVLPKPVSHYGVTKLAAEQLVLTYNRGGIFPACSLRPFSVYGPRERPDKLYPTLIRCLFEDRPFPLYEGSEFHRRSYTYVSDIVAGITATLPRLEDCAGEIINIGNDVSATTGEGIKIVEEIIGKKARIDLRPRRSGDQERTQADIQKARRILGYHPQIDLWEGLTNEVSWYRDHINGKFNF